MWHKKIEKIIVLLLSVALALNTFNPFRITNDNVDSNQESLTIASYLSILFIALFFFDKRFFGKFLELKKISVILFIFFLSILLSSIYYRSHSDAILDIFWLMKLFVAIIFWIMLTTYFLEEKKVLLLSMLFYSITCCILIIGYQIGILDSFVEIRNGRLIWYGENPNSTSSRIALAIIFLIYFIETDVWKLKNRRFFFLIIICALSFYIFESGSRGSFLAIIISLFIIFLFTPIKKGKKIQLFISIIFTIGIMYFFVMDSVSVEDYSMMNRIEELGGGNARTELMANAVEIFLDYPVFGAGESGYKQERIIRGFRTLDSHCILTSILAMGGIIGFFVFCSFLWKLTKTSLSVAKKSIIPFVIFSYMLLIALKSGGVLTYILMWYAYSISFSLSDYYKILYVKNKTKRLMK
jgi:hypothetical protein